MTQKERNEELIRRLYRSLADGKFDEYYQYLSDDITYYAAGDCFASGVHKGKEQLRKIGYTTFKETNGTHRVELKQIVATDSHVAVIDKWTATRKEKTIDMDNLIVYTVENGMVREIREFIGDEKIHDEFWE
ncbi:MAG: nuclear transport factor 2 family protein [bacterium]